MKEFRDEMDSIWEEKKEKNLTRRWFFNVFLYIDGKRSGREKKENRIDRMWYENYLWMWEIILSANEML